MRADTSPARHRALGRRARRFIAALCAITGAPIAVHADTPPAACWAASVAEPRSTDRLPNNHPSLAPVHRVLDVLEQMGRDNPGLARLPEVRLRARREILYADQPSRQPHIAALHLNGYGWKAWGRGACEVIPQADRLGAKAGISFFVNNPLATMNRFVHDEQLTAYLEGERGEDLMGWPVYGGCAVLSSERRLWWLPVTVGEWLDFQAREQQRQIDAHDRDTAQALQPFDLAAAEAQAEAVRPLNPKAADLALHVARERKRLEPKLHAGIRARRVALQAEWEAVQAHRQQLSPEALAEAFRLGTGRFGLPLASELAMPLKRLVKLDPTFPWDGRRRTRVQSIHVCPSNLDRNPRYGPPMREAVRTLDFQRIASLLQ